MIDENKDDLLFPSGDALEKLLNEKIHVGFQRPHKSVKQMEDQVDDDGDDKAKYKLMITNQNYEIAKLKVEIRNLKTANQCLNDTSIITDSSNFVLPKKESISIPPLKLTDYANRDALKSQLQNRTAELNIYKEKVLELQCKLIETRDDQLTQYNDGSDAGRCARLEAELRERKRRFRALENAYRTQDKVIEKFEQIFRKQLLHTSTGKSNADLKIVESLLHENKNLKSQLGKFKDASASMNQSFDNFLENDVSTTQRLDFLERRSQSLEKQMTDNARAWAREKAEMQLRVQQAELKLK